jgi:putative SOS response-associated peptidase YedK
MGAHSVLVEKTAKGVPSTFNARAETVANKPTFRTRCIVPASGYYEWHPISCILRRTTFCLFWLV